MFVTIFHKNLLKITLIAQCQMWNSQTAKNSNSILPLIHTFYREIFRSNLFKVGASLRRSSSSSSHQTKYRKKDNNSQLSVVHIFVNLCGWIFSPHLNDRHYRSVANVLEWWWLSSCERMTKNKSLSTRIFWMSWFVYVNLYNQIRTPW